MHRSDVLVGDGDMLTVLIVADKHKSVAAESSRRAAGQLVEFIAVAVVDYVIVEIVFVG